MDKKTSQRVTPTVGNAGLEPRLRSMLNLRTGPAVVLAELQASVRISRDAIDDRELDLLYPHARTCRDPRVSLEDGLNVVAGDDLRAIDKRLPAPPPAVAEARAHSVREDKKALGDSPKMPPDDMASMPKSQFSVFVQLDRLVDSDDEAAAERAHRTLADVEQMAGTTERMMRRRDLVSVAVEASQVAALAQLPGVASVETGDAVRKLLVESSGGAPKPDRRERRFTTQARQHRYGEGVIVGIIDVEGFDFAHEDFLDDGGGTRFLAIWDQAGDPATGGRDSPFAVRRSPRRGDYGSEITSEHMNAAIAAAPNVGLPATTLEPQSSMVRGSHGTHVASIAAGRSGVCGNARIVGVSLALADGDHDRRRSFYDTTRLAHAVDYIFDIAEMHDLPATINISLGTNGHSHDRSAAISRWIDYALTAPGRSVTVAAGNAGQTDRDANGGIGHLLGRVHAAGRIQGADLRVDVEWEVFGNGLVDISTNEMEIWYPAQDLFAVQLTAPNGEVFGPIESGHELVNHERADHTRVSVHNDRYHPVNGFNRISLFLTPFFATNNAGTTAVVGIESGTWTVQLIGREIRDGSWHSWIERDDPVVVDDAGPVIAFFPSAFGDGSFEPSTQISSLACGDWVNSVANLDAGRRLVNATSSRGPTRTGDPKPDLCAPGTAIVAANGFSGGWVEMTGTSMAAPYVTGVVGLMLAIDRRLTAPQISSILRRTASPLPGHTFEWMSTAGFGQVNPDRALTETAEFRRSRTSP